MSFHWEQTIWKGAKCMDCNHGITLIGWVIHETPPGKFVVYLSGGSGPNGDASFDLYEEAVAFVELVGKRWP